MSDASRGKCSKYEPPATKSIGRDAVFMNAPALGYEGHSPVQPASIHTLATNKLRSGQPTFGGWRGRRQFVENVRGPVFRTEGATRYEGRNK